MSLAALDWITDCIVAAVERREAVGAVPLTFLLRRYRATGRADLHALLEPALAQGLDDHRDDSTTTARAEWLTLFAEAAELSEDDALRDAAQNLASALQREWGRSVSVDSGAATVEACLVWGRGHQHDLVVVAVDELERIVAAAYEPEEGLRRLASRSCWESGYLTDHVGLSSALLAAYETTGRLPYPMLAEELMQFARRALWDDEQARFRTTASGEEASFALSCRAISVLCRLAALRTDAEYREAVSVAPGVGYGDLAERLLATEARRYQDEGVASAAYGLALAEWLALP